MALYKYLDLVTSEHSGKPKFIAWLKNNLRITDDCQMVLETFNDNFDIDKAVGKQQDTLGRIVGVSRALPFEPTDGSGPNLSDSMYRLVLKCKAAKNTWKGTIPEIYDIFEHIFPELGLIIEDKQDMSFTAFIYGTATELEQILLQNDYIIPRPDGVKLNIVNVTVVKASHYNVCTIKEMKRTVFNVPEPIQERKRERMANFQQPIITNKGKALYAKVLNGETLNFTKVKFGTGKLASGQNAEELTDLINYLLDGDIKSKSVKGNEASLNISFNNSTITSTVNISEIGIYAQDPDEGEILYLYVTAGDYGDYVTPPGFSVNSWAYTFNLSIANGANVTAQLSNVVYDFDVVCTSSIFGSVEGSNQKEINEFVDSKLTELISNQIYTINEAVEPVNNTYNIVIPSATLKVGLGICFMSKEAISGKEAFISFNGNTASNIKKSNGNNMTNIKKGQFLTLRWTGENFQSASGGSGAEDEATATGNSVLSNATFVNSNGEIEQGKIPLLNRKVYVPTTSNITIGKGQYLNGDQIIIGDTNLISSNILKGKSIFNVAGTATIQSLGGYIFKTISNINLLDGDQTVNCGFKPKFIIGIHGTGTEMGIALYLNGSWKSGGIASNSDDNTTPPGNTSAWGTITSTGFTITADIMPYYSTAYDKLYTFYVFG